MISSVDQLPSLVRGDPVRFGQVVTNLVANAVKFTQAGEVVVRASGTGPTASGSRSATPASASRPRCSAQLFAAFSQADSSTTREYGGTGLGLAISKRIVEAMGGTIGVDSEDGRGQHLLVHGAVPAPATGVRAADGAARGRGRRAAGARRRRQRHQPLHPRRAARAPGTSTSRSSSRRTTRSASWTRSVRRGDGVRRRAARLHDAGRSTGSSWPARSAPTSATTACGSRCCRRRWSPAAEWLARRRASTPSSPSRCSPRACSTSCAVAGRPVRRRTDRRGPQVAGAAAATASAAGCWSSRTTRSTSWSRPGCCAASAATW